MPALASTDIDSPVSIDWPRRTDPSRMPRSLALHRSIDAKSNAALESPADRFGLMLPERIKEDYLKVIYMEQWTDQRSGVRTVGLARLSRAEPDHALFHEPRG